MQQTTEDFNYACAVLAGILFVAGVYWFLPKCMGGARHHFTGPVRPEFFSKYDSSPETKENMIEEKINNFRRKSAANNKEEIKDIFAIEADPLDINLRSNRPFNQEIEMGDFALSKESDVEVREENKASTIKS